MLKLWRKYWNSCQLSVVWFMRRIKLYISGLTSQIIIAWWWQRSKQVKMCPKWTIAVRKLKKRKLVLPNRKLWCLNIISAKRKPKCCHCGKYGHIKRDYWLLGEDMKETGFKRHYSKRKAYTTMELQGESSSPENDYVVGIVTNNALSTNNEKNNWTVDSGACLVIWKKL